MRILILLLISFFSIQTFAQFEKIDKTQRFGAIIQGQYNHTITTQDYEPTSSSVSYNYFGITDFEYQKVINQRIKEYIEFCMIDTAYFPIEENLSPKFFEDALNNFVESYNYVRFRLGDDVHPFWINTSILIDTINFKNYVQVANTSNIYTAGAHPYIMDEYLIVSKEKGQIITWKNLVKEDQLDAFTSVIEKYFKKVEGLKKKDDIITNSTANHWSEEELKEKTDNFRIPIYFFSSKRFELSKNFQFTKKGIRLIYLPYEAREWARGSIIVNVPKRKIKKYLNFNW